MYIPRMARSRAKSLLNVFMDDQIKFYLLILVTFILVQILYVWLTPFEKTVIINSKIGYASGKYLYNTVSDKSGLVYHISNSLPLLHFTSAEVFLKIQPENQYKIKGYGMRVPFLGLYPNITSIV